MTLLHATNERLSVQKFFLHTLYFSFWTLLPLIAVIPFERRHEEAYIMSLAIGMIMAAGASLFNFSRWYYFITFPILAIPGLIDIGHIWMFRGRITANLFFTVFDTNMSEAGDFFSDYITIGIVLFLLSYLLFMLNLLRWCLKNPIQMTSKRKLTFLMIGIAPLLITSFKKGGAPWAERVGAGTSIFKITTAYLDYNAQIGSYQKILKDGIQFAEDVKHANDKSVTHVLVIGEASNRNHWSLYGYPRDTNPLLSKVEDLKVYKSVLCPNPPHTVINIQKLLTFADTKTFSMNKVAPSLLQIAKKAGYKTFWFSNQLMLGTSNNMTTILARQSDKSQFVNLSNGANYDEKLIPHLESALADTAPKKLIILHLFGSHSLYKERYPSEFSKFEGKEGITSKLELDDTSLSRINAYDNSVLYQDFIINKMLTLAKAKAQSFVFVPDHGEEVFDEIDFNGHTESMPTKGMYQIPLIFWAKNYAGLEIDLNRKFISENLIDSLTHMYGWQYPSQNLTKSIWSNTYANNEVLEVENTVIEY